MHVTLGLRDQLQCHLASTFGHLTSATMPIMTMPRLWTNMLLMAILELHDHCC
jgi:hypothetical protein